MPRPGFDSVDAYLAAQPAAARPVLDQVRMVLRKALPGAEEAISYQIPVFKLNGRVVLYFAGFKEHFSIYPATPRVVAELGDDIAPHLWSKGTMRFPLTGRVPVKLITRIAKVRLEEALAAQVAKGMKKTTVRKR
jgi:uncharacterized protein YdhG (YjbR/CyaY superfamily)